ncbi:hypothetical protein SPRA44_600207 [Serratia proteamaculans]|nr:hypothetical protein SPRA44_600207 [Serratia proteamaculans]
MCVHYSRVGSMLKALLKRTPVFERASLRKSFFRLY